jgi:hypothetical protein
LEALSAEQLNEEGKKKSRLESRKQARKARDETLRRPSLPRHGTAQPELMLDSTVPSFSWATPAVQGHSLDTQSPGKSIR